MSPELLPAAISDSCGDYHYHSVQREKTDAHAEKFHQVIFSRLAGCENRREQTTVILLMFFALNHPCLVLAFAERNLAWLIK